ELLTENPKSIVFCHFKETIAYYKSLLGNQAYYIKGDDKRDLPLVLQTKGDKPLIATYSLKEGINLQFYNQVIFHTLPLAYRDFVQAVGRVYRTGQEKSVEIKILVNQAFEVDPLVVQILKRKTDVLRYIRQDITLLRRFAR
ncbi:MAG: helicase-related protein, partial [Aquificaceae bacterium]